MEKIGGKLYLTHLGRHFWFPVPGPSAGHKEKHCSSPFSIYLHSRPHQTREGGMGARPPAPPPPGLSLPELKAQTSISLLPSVLPPFSLSQSPASFS